MAKRKNNVKSTKPPISGRQVVSQRTNAPVARAYTLRNREPMIRMNGRTSIRIRHRELCLGLIPGAVSFTIDNTLRANPGLPLTFPWLATQAANWEQYAVHSLKFEYIPICSTATAGDVYLIPEYDVSNAAPITETQAANLLGMVTTSCWNSMVLSCDRAAMMALGPRRFIRNGNIAGDLKTFDVMKLYVCTVNQANTATVGKLFVEYDIELFIPDSAPSIYPTAPTMDSMIVFPSAIVGAGTAGTQPLTFQVGFDPLGLFQGAVPGIWYPPPGVYRVHIQAAMNVVVPANTFSSSNLVFAALEVYLDGAPATPTGFPNAVVANDEPTNASTSTAYYQNAQLTGLFIIVIAPGSSMQIVAVWGGLQPTWNVNLVFGSLIMSPA
jgi:hypothetical protein